MHEILNDPIDLNVDFKNKFVRPQKIWWDKRTYNIQSVNLIHRAKEGHKNIFYFSVSDHVNYLKLRLDPEFMEWRLVELYTDG